MATKKPRIKITQEQIDATLKAFKSLPEPEVSAKKFSKIEAIKGMKSEIQALLKRGFLIDDIVKSMAGTGIDITSTSLKSYMARSATKKPKLTPKIITKTEENIVEKKLVISKISADHKSGSGGFTPITDLI